MSLRDDVDPEAGCVQNVTLIWFFGVFNDFILIYVCLCTVMYICAMYFPGYYETLWISLLHVAYLVCVKINSCRNDELG